MILTLGACRGPGLPVGGGATPGREQVRVEVWVDAAWWRPGDGSRERPLRSLAEALARPGPLTVHLAAGAYRGPFTLPEDVRLEGEGPGTVLLVETPQGTVLRAAGPSGGGEGPASDGQRVPPPISPGSQGLPFRPAGHGGFPLSPLGVRGSVAVSSGSPLKATDPQDLSSPATGTGGVLLRNLEVRGGTWGLEVTGGGRVLVENVGFSGQRQGAVRVTSGRFDAVDARFEATVSETVGVLLDAPEEAPSPPSSRDAWLRGTSFTGPFRRAVRVRGAESRVLLEDVRFTGPVTALGMDGGHAEVRRAVSEGGRGAAFSVVEGSLVMEDVRVRGHELAVSAMRALRLEVRGLFSVGAERAGLGVVASRGVLLEDVVVRGSGSHGAFQLTGSEVEARRLHVEDAAEYGVVAVGGSLKLTGGTVVGVRAVDGITGDGLHLRQVRADVEGVVIRRTTGACVLAAQNARVYLRDAELEQCGQAALLVDTLARLDATGVEARDSGETVLAAMGDGDLRVDALLIRGASQGLIWAECTGDTRVRLGRIRTEDRRGEEAPCVERLAEPRPGPR
ncbi:hypothetical protein FJV41_39395 [Myxococcus llanfairpwllgwyngyllgogerychwyrndrobwllllantysiliogogogochensis]|uniref:DUF1565 domain-containing protein n=2 Tax=Myxococcus llanfairpwllgwyngyllgogerychwyrndrobwllllantysiliogogogochensis TaxID=2590453 RepID=A0A540WPW1_9BACT|nr:hypothetical protein FJV41_39395 [Myxococcus llanfairpwllgwyngyllgogerychwyrndrobwllllantysiliogogogochensis]